MNQLLTVAQHRVASHRIAPPSFENPEDVVVWMGAIQAQDYQQSLWAIGSRLADSVLAKERIERAITEGKIIRTWPMRGTIHFVPAEDAGWMIQLCAVRLIAKDKRRQEMLVLNLEILAQCRSLITDALHGNNRLTRPAVMELLENAGISTKGQRGYHILWFLAQSGVICLGPMENKEQTFVLLEEWVSSPRVLSREDSIAELVRRFFTSHAPATIQDFVWWSGLTVSDTKRGLATLGSEIVAEKSSGKEYWVPSGSSIHAKDTEPTVQLLAAFDEYLLGYADRKTILDPQHADRVCPGGNGVFYPMIVKDGQIIGTWKRTFKKNVIQIVREEFIPFSLQDIQAYEEETARFGKFWGLPIVLD